MFNNEKLIITIWAIFVAAILLLMVTGLARGHGEGCTVDGHTLRHVSDPTVKAQFGVAGAPHVHGYFDSNGSGYAVAAPGPLRSDCRTPAPSTEPATQPVAAHSIRGYGCDTLGFLAPTEICHEWDLNITHRVGVPVLPAGVKTIADLWDHIRWLTGKRVTIQTLVNGAWRTYKGESNETGDTEITPHIGLIIWHAPPFVLGVAGVPAQGETIELTIPTGKNVAVHAIGFPEPPAAYEKLSDLVVDGVDWVSRRIRVDGVLRYLYIRNAGDPGDKVIEAGDFVIIRIRRDLTFNFSAGVPAAPAALRTLTTSWGAIKGKSR